MKIHINGLNFENGLPIGGPVDRDLLGAQILSSLIENSAQIKRLSSTTSAATSFRGQLERERTPDLGDPNAVGWTILVAEQDPRRDELLDALEPLAVFRGMADPAVPLIFPPMEEDEWFDWLQENYLTLEKARPFYVLIVGGPDLIPFRFQARLDTAAAVGRLDLDTTGDVRAYVDKVLRHERATTPPTGREALFFATDGGPEDATYFSHHYLAAPLAEHAQKLGMKVQRVFDADASKHRLLAVQSEQPALVFTATHGVEAGKYASFDEKRRLNGAICCEQENGSTFEESLLTAADVPPKLAFYEGSIFFQFACFGYGTPAESDFHHWTDGGVDLNAPSDFTAALPKRLVSHPSGPLAVVAHLDLAWLHGFDDPSAPHPIDGSHPRITPFATAISRLVEFQPVGFAMSDFNQRFDLTNAQLASTVDRLQRGRLADTPELRGRIADVFVLRTDAQNYMVLGDPAVRLHFPT